MSEPWSEVSTPSQYPTDGTAAPAAPKGLLEQMQELLASVTADLADLQAIGARTTSPAATASAAGEDGGLSAAR
ncbi:hypothetical protein [Kitasatospora purpeofusca]|uniref:hypothetical protein n=1 Tax=Kitasatospora purpeofusca TaxID=67352 RepID=UPI0022557DEB|nr:hypothetical protein [Kitasatospora purpeofusca]MCX4752792.1 hypothetical protein [Kitasatospora purpeofusca]WSR32347.1 hypothetical protein OG715_15925 [Kitasatospora purpeofusca]